jgi:hypothetical protein
VTGAKGAPVHQLVFRWDAGHSGGPAGMRAVAYSCDRELAELAFSLAGPALWGGEREPALVRLVRGDTVLLLRRRAARDAHGRPSSLSHGLLGNPATLPALLALGLHRWTWPGAQLRLDAVRGALDPVDPDELRASAGPAMAVLYEAVPPMAEPLAAAVAQALRRTERPMLVLDRTGGAGTLPILFGFVDIVGVVAGGPLSYASLARDEADRARIAFVPGCPDTTLAESTAVFVDPADPPQDWAADLARYLIDQYVSSRDAFRALLASVAEFRPGPARVSQLTRIAGVLYASGGRPVGERRRPGDAEPMRPKGLPRPHAATRTLPTDSTLSAPTGPSAGTPAQAASAPEQAPDARGQAPGVPVLAARPPVRRRHTERAGPRMPMSRADRERALAAFVAELRSRRRKPVLLGMLSEFDDEAILAVLDGRIDWQTAEQFLAELVARAGQRDRRRAMLVCCAAMRAGLYVGRWPQAPAPTATALQLFEQLVRPWIRGGRPAAAASDLLQRLIIAGGHEILRRVVEDTALPELLDPAWRTNLRSLRRYRRLLADRLRYRSG